jgi:hypothetical protein
MTLQHQDSYPAALQDSLKSNWRVDDLIGGDKKLDFSRPFLPNSLALTSAGLQRVRATAQALS